MKIHGQTRALRYLSEGLRQHRLAPSLLFIGPDGVGKRLTAAELARSFACADVSIESGTSLSCGECGPCRKVTEGNHIDVLMINRSLQAAILKEKPESQTAIKIDTVRHIEKFLRLKPMESRKRTAIIDEADKLTNDAANALLKILEEPPNNAQLVLLSVDERNLPSTVVSRCAVVRFSPLPVSIIAAWLADAHSVSKDRALELGEASGGSFAKALRLKDQEPESLKLESFGPDEFFDWINNASWRKEGRARAERLLTHLIEQTQSEMGFDEPARATRLRSILRARRQLDRHVPPRLVLESLYLRLVPVFSEREGNRA